MGSIIVMMVVVRWIQSPVPVMDMLMYMGVPAMSMVISGFQYNCIMHMKISGRMSMYMADFISIDIDVNFVVTDIGDTQCAIDIAARFTFFGLRLF